MLLGNPATGFKRAQGNAHCAKFESNTNRMTFEYAPNMMIVKVHHVVVSSSVTIFFKILLLLFFSSKIFTTYM